MGKYGSSVTCLDDLLLLNVLFVNRERDGIIFKVRWVMRRGGYEERRTIAQD